MKKYTFFTTPFLCLIILSILAGNAGAQRQDVIKGRVLDVLTKKPLFNVSVLVWRSEKGTITNDSGYFSIRAPGQTKFTLIFSSIGYYDAAVPIDLSARGRDTSLLIEMKKQADAQLDEVIVNALKDRVGVNTTEMNVVKINPDLIKRNLVLLGEADIIKALMLQTGVTTAGEGAGGFNVRGGTEDQNLVLVDGAPLFNTSHLLGFFTSVSPDAVQDVTLYKGGMPAQYGGRLSSLLNLKIKSGNSGAMQYTTGVGPVSAHIFMNGPLIKNKLTFTAGVRAAYPDLILNNLPSKYGASRAFFYDAMLKAEYSFNSNNKLSVTGYRSFDKFRFDTTTYYDWQSDLVALNFTSKITSRLSVNLNANYSRFISGINTLSAGYQSKLSSAIEQKQGKLTFVYSPTGKNSVTAGLDYIYYTISPGSINPTSAESSVNSVVTPHEQGREAAAFLSDEVKFSDRIGLQAGLRYVVYNYLGPKDVYYYKPGVPMSRETIADSVNFSHNKSIQQYAGIEPRVSLKIGINDNLTLKFSYNRQQQFLHLISNTTAISPVDFWKLSDNYIRGQAGDQYSAGMFANLASVTWQMSVEAYYRTIQNTLDYKDGASLLMNRYIETALLNARGRGYGIEFSLLKTTGKFTGQFNYTYSKTEIQVLNQYPSEEVNNGSYYPANTDRPHNLAIVAKVKMPKGWSFNCAFVYSTGRPATYPDGYYSYNGTVVVDYSKRNMDRLPAYHRLDAGFSYVSRRYENQKRYSIWNFSFYNLYMHANAYSIYFQRQNNLLASYRLSVIGTIIPSISWTYNF
ncbi:MAG TPA: TonB-dependent receptor [Chitinophagaceae bacterium]|nr:TonB-dependent receptor [Chitinophagaceae bacterium]